VIAVVPILASFLLSPSVAQGGRCGASVKAETAPLRGQSGTSAVLQLHTDDDHDKNSHLCESWYSLRITEPDGTQRQTGNLIGNDDSWNRSISFRLEGFTPGDHALIALIIEGGKYPIHEVLLYERTSGSFDVLDLSRSFAHQLSPACQQTLRVVGTRRDEIVLSSTRTNGCNVDQEWTLEVKEDASGQETPTRPHLFTGASGYSKLTSILASP
jgi:hypothetical protein